MPKRFHPFSPNLVKHLFEKDASCPGTGQAAILDLQDQFSGPRSASPRPPQSFLISLPESSDESWKMFYNESTRWLMVTVKVMYMWQNYFSTVVHAWYKFGESGSIPSLITAWTHHTTGRGRSSYNWLKMSRSYLIEHLDNYKIWI